MSPMKVGIFAPTVGRDVGGLETYETELVRSLARIDRDNRYHVFHAHPGAPERIAVAQENVSYHRLAGGSRLAALLAGLPLALRSTAIDLLHAAFVPPVWPGTPFVQTVHDLCVLQHPALYPPHIRLRVRSLVYSGFRRARALICVSDHTRAALESAFAIAPGRVVTIPHGVGGRFRPLGASESRERLRTRYGIAGPYILYLGAIRQESKNLVRVLEAFERFRAGEPDSVRLVLVGGRVWDNAGVDAVIRRPGLRDHVVQTGHVPETDLPAFYGGAVMLAFPSLCEGFGFPVIEAMASGTPVLTSNLSALPEAAGGAAWLVDPYSVDAIADGMRRLYRDEPLRVALRERGLERARGCDWDRAARSTLAVYERVHAGPSR